MRSGLSSHFVRTLRCVFQRFCRRCWGFGLWLGSRTVKILVVIFLKIVVFGWVAWAFQFRKELLRKFLRHVGLGFLPILTLSFVVWWGVKTDYLVFSNKKHLSFSYFYRIEIHCLNGFTCFYPNDLEKISPMRNATNLTPCLCDFAQFLYFKFKRRVGSEWVNFHPITASKITAFLISLQ